MILLCLFYQMIIADIIEDLKKPYFDFGYKLTGALIVSGYVLAVCIYVLLVFFAIF